MIRIDRDRLSGGRPIHPGADWQQRADDEAAVARAEGDAHEVKDSIYASDAARAALEELTWLKCAYCETSIDRFAWDVEHFRPKGRVKERPHDHHGYYWLAYDWNNLLPSCQFCNQNRKEKPVFDGSATAGTGGKLDQFPIADEACRAMDHTDDIGREAPLLIDPASEAPENHLGYLPDGKMFAVADSAKGEASIRVFRLNLLRISRRRKTKVPLLTELLALRHSAEAAGLAQVVASVQSMCDSLSADDQEFAGFVRYFVKNPAALGIGV